MEVYLTNLLKDGGVAGALVVTVVLAVGLLLRSRGLLSPPVDQKLSADALNDLSGRVGNLDQRLSQVEREIKHLPTREEMHEVELAMTRLSGRMDGVERTTTATNHAVQRIENFLIEVSKKGK